MPNIKPDNRPSTYEYAFFSNHVYTDTINAGDQLQEFPDWNIHAVKRGRMGYFGAIYINEKTKQIVLAHKGTYSLKAVLEDIWGIIKGKISPQKEEAFDFAKDAIEFAQKNDYHLSFTGHSLGGFLAELCVYYCYRSFNFTDVSAVTFESPGSKESIEALQSNQEPIDVNQFDITGYVSYPNRVNTCNHHIGSLYHLETNLGHYGWVQGWYLKQAHSMNNIVAMTKAKGADFYPVYMSDWPIGSQSNVFFKYAQFSNGIYDLTEQEDEIIKRNSQQFDLDYRAHYSSDDQLTGQQTLPLRHFSESMQLFLKGFYKNIVQISQNEQLLNQLLEKWQTAKIPPEICGYLLGYTLKKNSRDIWQVVLNKGIDVISFRQRLSLWLAENGDKIVELLNLPNNPNHNLVKIMATVIAPDAQIAKGAVIENLNAILLDIDIPEDTNQQNIDNLEKLLKTILAGSESIELVGIGSKQPFEGTVKNSTAALMRARVRERQGPHGRTSNNNQSTKDNSGQMLTQHWQRDGFIQAPNETAESSEKSDEGVKKKSETANFQNA